MKSASRRRTLAIKPRWGEIPMEGVVLLVPTSTALSCAHGWRRHRGVSAGEVEDAYRAVAEWRCVGAGLTDVYVAGPMA